MPTIGSFDVFFHGAPLPLVQSSTGGFDYWFHNAPLVLVTVGTRVTTLDMRARISRQSTVTLTMRARIRQYHLLNMRTRVSRRQGWPVPDVGDPALDGFTPTQLTMKASVLPPSFGLASIQARAKVLHQSTHNLNVRCRIVIAKQIQMKARVSNKVSVAVPMTYDVSKTVQVRRSMVFYVSGSFEKQSVQFRAYIIKTKRSRITGHFLVVSGNNTGSVNTFTASLNPSTQQSLRVGAGIVRL